MSNTTLLVIAIVSVAVCVLLIYGIVRILKKLTRGVCGIFKRNPKKAK